MCHLISSIGSQPCMSPHPFCRSRAGVPAGPPPPPPSQGGAAWTPAVPDRWLRAATPPPSHLPKSHIAAPCFPTRSQNVPLATTRPLSVGCLSQGGVWQRHRSRACRKQAYLLGDSLFQGRNTPDNVEVRHLVARDFEYWLFFLIYWIINNLVWL